MTERAVASHSSWAAGSVNGQLQSIPVIRGYRSKNQFKVGSKEVISNIAGVRDNER
jgi:hypothetical protein